MTSTKRESQTCRVFCSERICLLSSGVLISCLEEEHRCRGLRLERYIIIKVQMQFVCYVFRGILMADATKKNIFFPILQRFLIL